VSRKRGSPRSVQVPFRRQGHGEKTSAQDGTSSEDGTRRLPVGEAEPPSDRNCPRAHFGRGGGNRPGGGDVTLKREVFHPNQPFESGRSKSESGFWAGCLGKLMVSRRVQVPISPNWQTPQSRGLDGAMCSCCSCTWPRQARPPRTSSSHAAVARTQAHTATDAHPRCLLLVLLLLLYLLVARNGCDAGPELIDLLQLWLLSGRGVCIQLVCIGHGSISSFTANLLLRLLRTALTIDLD
jgi:hypothetical protein